MKTRNSIIVVAVILQLILALTPLIPGLKSLLPVEPSEREHLDWSIQFTGYSFAILTASVALLLIIQDGERQEFQKRLLGAFPQTNIERLRDDEFYTSFLTAIGRAQYSVAIMYLAAHPPDDTKRSDRHRYYDALREAIHRQTGIRFSRIIRLTPKTRSWISELLNSLDGCPNANVAILKDHETDERALSLSTQVIDSRKVWLVALKDHERKGAYRDLLIENHVVAEAFQDYYDRIWERCDVYLDAGRLTTSGKKFLKKE